MRKYDTIQTTSKETTVYFNNAENDYTTWSTNCLYI